MWNVSETRPTQRDARERARVALTVRGRTLTPYTGYDDVSVCAVSPSHIHRMP